MMMAPFDVIQVPQQGQPNVGQQTSSDSGRSGHVVQVNPGYTHQHRNGLITGGQPPPHHSSGMPQQSPFRQGSFEPPQDVSSGYQRHSRNDPDVKARILNKQRRLLLLHHSAKCPHEHSRCTATPHCADMKLLWRHMEACKDNNCKVPHCFSSRAILSHYRKCRNSNCPTCGPVRESARKNRSLMPGTNQKIATNVRSRL